MKNGTLKRFRYQKKTVLLAFALVLLSIGIGCQHEQSKVISQVFMKYRTDTATPTLELMEQRSFNLNDPADRRTVSITSTSFSNMQVTVH